MAVSAVLIMLVIALVPMVHGSEDDDGAGAVTSVVYHMYKPGEKPEVDSNCNDTTSGDSIPSITVQYNGVVSTEYNPQKWKGTVKGKITSGGDSDWFPINNYQEGRTIVFTGWVYEIDTADGTEYSSQGDIGYYPGEVIRPNQYSFIDGAIHVYATWGVLENHASVSEYEYGRSGSPTSGWNSGNAFTNILVLDTGNYTLKNGVFSKPVTLSGQGAGTSVTLNGRISLTGDCIIDNLAIRHAKVTGANHGYGTDVGMYANGNNLVMGTGMSASLSDVNGSALEQYLLQIIGGSFSDNGEVSVERTNVIIHSGYYYTIVAGGQGNGENNKSLIEKDTNVTIRGGMVLDTVVGGCSGKEDSVGGDTYVYLIGDAVMPGDYYEERFLDQNYNLRIGKDVQLSESSILTGGSNRSEVCGDTSVYISNDAQAWDVQGAGRGGLSTVKGTANVHVSGNALVKHVVNGSITDGLNGRADDSSPTGANQCVKNTNIVISDDAEVASVFGAGYDTFYASNYSSMYNGGTISIRVEGGTVGYVYGGGYRGSIGVTDNNDSTIPQPLESITIDIEKGRVLYDVFGGGRGGLDKVCHESDGTISWGSSQDDTVGHSRVYAKTITIKVGAGAEVGGNVYGGGESTPIITSYDGVTAPYDSKKTLGGSNDGKVASVVCDKIELNISGKVAGSVYGAGKGIDLSDTVDGRHSTAYIFAMDSSGDLKRIPWTSGNGASTVCMTSGYGDFALMTSVMISVTVNEGSSIGGSVYGGGAFSRTVADSIAVSILGGEMANVHGGGLGSLGSVSTKASRKVTVSGGTIRGSVYGSSSLGDDGDSFASYDVEIEIGGGKVSGSVYGGGYKGETYGSVSMELKEKAVIEESVYGGADIGTTSDPQSGWNSTLVHGDSTITIDGSEGLKIGMSIFGSGNSCLVSGSKKVSISGFVSDDDFESLQNIDELVISGSEIELTGRVDGTSAQASTKYSLNGIGKLSLVDGTDMDFQAAINNLSSYGSYVTNGDVLSSTTESSPKNSIRLSDGVVFEVRTTSDAGIVYGPVEGYTILSIHVAEQYYGALAYGSKDSLNGGFMVLGSGTLIKASTTIFNDCFCWYIAGAVRYTTTVVAYADSGGSSSNQTVYATLPKMSNTTSIVYVGHSTFQAKPGSLNLVHNLESSSDFRLTMGGPGGTMVFDNGGIPITGQQMSVDPVPGTVNGGGGTSIPRIAYELEFLTQEYTGYVGSVHFSYWEAVETSFDGGGRGYILQNRIDIELEIYTESLGGNFGSDDAHRSYDVPIHSVDGSGSSIFVIPRSFHDYKVYLVSATGDSIARMTVTPVYNEERTLGWEQPMQGDIKPVKGAYIGTLKGSFHASLDIRVYGAGEGDKSELSFKMESPSGDIRTFCLHVQTTPATSHNVAFIDDVMNPGGSTVISVIAGGTISNSLVPLTGDHFIGWFLDGGYNRLFNLGTPITHDIELHALYRYAVTFDLMNGQKFVDYVDMSQSTAISKPDDPSRDGYEFAGWLKDIDGKRVDAFVGGYETILNDTTFYVKWDGKPVVITYKLEFGGKEWSGVSTREFGSTYGDKLNEFTDNAVKALEGTAYKFVRWVDGSGNFAYNDTLLYHSEDHVLTADCTTFALEVNLSKGSVEGNFFGDPVINAPVNFLVYEKDEVFSFIPSNATTTGYYLSGWTFTLKDETSISGNKTFTVPAGAEIEFTKSNDTESFIYKDGGKQYYHSGILILDAVWEPLLYEVGFQEPIGGEIQCDADDLSELRYNQDITLEYVPNPNLPYSLDSWVVSGECSYTVSGNKMILTVHGNCYVSVRLGGMYDVSVTLRIDSLADTMDRGLTLVSATGDRRSLKWENGRYMHSAVEAGVYSLVMKDGSGSFVIDDSVTVLERTERSYELYTISVTCVPEELFGKLTPPGFSIEGRQVEIPFDVGYIATVRNDDIGTRVEIDRIVFEMPAEAVSLEVVLKEKMITVSLDYDGGTDKTGRQDYSITVQYYGMYDFGSLGVEKENFELKHWVDSQGRQYIDGFKVNPEVTSLTAVWKEKDSVEYKVVLHYQNVERSGYVEGETLTYYGIKDAVTEYLPPERSGFITPEKVQIRIEVTAGPTILEYDRMVYSVSVTVHNDYKPMEMVYGTPLSKDTVDVGNGYEYAGWFSDERMTIPVDSVPAFSESVCKLYVKTVPKTYEILYKDGTTGALHQGVRGSYIYGEDPTKIDDVRLVKEGYHISCFLYDGEPCEEIGKEFVDDHPGQNQFFIDVEWVHDSVKVTIYRPEVGNIFVDGVEANFMESIFELTVGYGSRVVLEFKAENDELYAWAVGNDVVYVEGLEHKEHELVATCDTSVSAIIKLRANDIRTLSVSWAVVKGSGYTEDGKMIYIYGQVSLDDFVASEGDVIVEISKGILSIGCDPTVTGTVFLPRLMPPDGSFILSVELYIVDNIIDVGSAELISHAQISYLLQGSVL